MLMCKPKLYLCLALGTTRAVCTCVVCTDYCRAFLAVWALVHDALTHSIGSVLVPLKTLSCYLLHNMDKVVALVAADLADISIMWARQPSLGYLYWQTIPCFKTNIYIKSSRSGHATVSS